MTMAYMIKVGHIAKLPCNPTLTNFGSITLHR